MGMLSRFLERRNWRRKARAYLSVIQREPAEQDAAWLAEQEPRNDLDHARWELRYARLALGQVEAERDALDDRLPAAVARGIVALLQSDYRVAAGMVEVAERQFNARLRRYRDALLDRGSAEPLRRRLGRALLSFTHGDRRWEHAAEERAGEMLEGYLREFDRALQEAFGRAELPEDVRPSEVSAA